jgi:glycosyltransferase involved in cell wall biosynthesis
MAMGIPVVASDVAALREQVTDGETGLLFRAGDPADAARAAIDVARDAPARRRLAETALAHVRAERDWRIVTGVYDELYARLFDGR